LIIVINECLTRSSNENPASTYIVLPSVYPAHDPDMEPEISTTETRSIAGHSVTSSILS